MPKSFTTSPQQMKKKNESQMEREFTEESDNENNIQEQFKNYKS